MIHIKKELYKYKEQPVDQQQKRLFPGFNVYDKPKVKKISSKPSPFANAAASFSQSRASSSMSSQAISTLSENTPNDKASVRMPMLASLASPMINPISNTKQVVNVRAEPEVPITRSSIPPDDPPSLTENPPLPDQPKKIRRPTETENKVNRNSVHLIQALTSTFYIAKTVCSPFNTSLSTMERNTP